MSLPSENLSCHSLFRSLALAAFFLVAWSASGSGHAALAFIEGEAIYFERIMPPPDATLVVTLQNTTRAHAAAIEHASTRVRLGGGPPYAWRLTYDPQLGDLQQLTLRVIFSMGPHKAHQF